MELCFHQQEEALINTVGSNQRFLPRTTVEKLLSRMRPSDEDLLLLLFPHEPCTPLTIAFLCKFHNTIIKDTKAHNQTEVSPVLFAGLAH